ncbi:MAG: dihydrolipoyl dehydrogenase [Pseudomonadota bacterium]
MTSKITIIGAGPGGYVAAIRAAQLGAEVTLIEHDNVGGTCLNRGCVPSKVMRTSAEILEKFHRAQEFGINVTGKVYPDMQRLMARKEKVIRDHMKGIFKLLNHHRVSYLKGYAYIDGANLVKVKLPDNTIHEVPWDRLILAVGSQPLNITSFPFDGKKIISSNEALCLSEIPESLAIVGGGVIGCEFAFIFAALGSHVIVVEAMSRLLPLPSVDENCSKVLQREMKKRKIKFIVNQTVERVEDKEGKCHVTIGPSPFAAIQKERGLNPQKVEVEKVLVCIGRKPNTANIGLEKLGVKTDENGWIIADERMETSIPEVYAIGDVLGPAKIMLAHVASKEGLIAAENAMGRNRTMNYNLVPGAIFTMPEVANVGLTEAQAKKQGPNVRADTVLFRNVAKAQVIGEIAGEVKIVSDTETGRILGVHIIGPHATDLIGEGTLAIQMGCTVKELSETIHAHPTLAEIMLEASYKALGKALHG